jgi:hypothetical protein
LIKLITHATASAYKRFQNGKKYFFTTINLFSIYKFCLQFGSKTDKDNYAFFKEWKDLKILSNKLEENLDNIKDKFSFQFFEVFTI